MTDIEGMTRAKCIRSIETSVDYGFPFLTLFRTYRVVNIYEEEENKE